MKRVGYLGFLIFAACASESRGPSSISDTQLQTQALEQLHIDIAEKTNAQWENEQALLGAERVTGNESVLKSLGNTKDRLGKELASANAQEAVVLESLARSLQGKSWDANGPWFETTTKVHGLTHEESFVLRDLESFRRDRGSVPSFALEHRAASAVYRLRLENLVSPPSTSSGEVTRPLVAQLDCDGEFTTSTKSIFGAAGKPTRSYGFSWYFNRENGQKVVLQFSDSVSKCRLQFKEATSKEFTHEVNFEAAESLLPFWTAVATGVEICARPISSTDNGSSMGPAQFFWQQDFNAVTCPRALQDFKTLRNPLTAFNEKIKSLTGTDLPLDVLRTKNPTVPLDFSKAPQLDVIWVSSLSFTADLYGAVLAQALRYHADHGTQIRILVPRARTFKKDEALLFQLQKGRPNVKVQIYEFNRGNGRSGDFIDRFHRVNHVKILLGYSAKNPGNSFIVTGGRNIGDSYLLKTVPDYSAYPWLINYGAKEKPFVYYDDFEVKFKGSDLAKSVLSQLISFWNRDSGTQLFRSSNFNVPFRAAKEILTQPMVRHLLSVPYVDGRKLEKFYVQMLDSAQKEILVTTPYFTPTEAISGAFHRAHLRGVKVKVLTGMSLAGDDIPSIVEDANKKGVNRHLAELEIYQWTAPASIMHAKLLVIDEKLSFISSVNLNGRSFNHDTESGVLILHDATSLQMKKEILGYLKTSELMTEQLKIKFLNGLLLKVMDSYF